MEERHRRREEELVTQLQQKDVELEQKNADISRLQGQTKRNADISKQAPVPVCYYAVTYKHFAALHVLTTGVYTEIILVITSTGSYQRKL